MMTPVTQAGCVLDFTPSRSHGRTRCAPFFARLPNLSITLVFFWPLFECVTDFSCADLRPQGTREQTAASRVLLGVRQTPSTRRSYQTRGCGGTPGQTATDRIRPVAVWRFVFSRSSASNCLVPGEPGIH